MSHLEKRTLIVGVMGVWVLLFGTPAAQAQILKSAGWNNSNTSTCSSCGTPLLGGSCGKKDCPGRKLNPVFDSQYIKKFCGPTVNPCVCFGYYRTQWRPWHEACGESIPENPGPQTANTPAEEVPAKPAAAAPAPAAPAAVPAAPADKAPAPAPKAQDKAPKSQGAMLPGTPSRLNGPIVPQQIATQQLAPVEPIAPALPPVIQIPIINVSQPK